MKETILGREKGKNKPTASFVHCLSSIAPEGKTAASPYLLKGFLAA